MEVRILGPLEARENGRVLDLGGPRPRALFTILLLHLGEVVPSDRLIDELWGERPPRSAGHLLHVYVSNLRKELGSRLVTRQPGYLLDVAPGEVDARRFELLAEEGLEQLAGGEARAASAKLHEALDLWRGPALADFSYEAFAATEIARLNELRLATLEARISADLDLSRHDLVIPELESLVAEHPLRERLKELLMLALYRAGRQAEALEVYRSARSTLVEELGIEPSPALQKLQHEILTHDPSLGAVRPRGSRRRGRAPLVGLALLAVGAVAASLLLLTDDPNPIVVEPNSVAVVDPDSNEVVADIPVGTSPTAVAAGAEAVWASSAEDQTVFRIDRAIRTVERTIGLGAPPSSLAVGEGGLWIATGSAGTLIHADATSGTPMETLDLGGSQLAPDPTFAVAAGFGSVWVASGGGAIIRVDPATTRVRSRIATPLSPIGLAVGREAVWSVLADGTVLRIDPGSEAITGRVETGPDPFEIESGLGSVWVSNVGGSAADQGVWRIDEPTGTVKAVIPLRQPRGIATGPDAIWVATGEAGHIVRIDPLSNHIVERVQLGRLPFDVVRADGLLWVSVVEPGAVVNP